MGSKAGSAVVCILCALLLLMQAIIVNSLLEEPEFHSPGIIISEDGTMSTVGELEPNSDYIPEGSYKRAFYISSRTSCRAVRHCRLQNML